jgi:hypothetical protein
MLYAILCYADEGTFAAMTAEEEAAAVSCMRGVKETYAANGQLGPSLRLMKTTAAVTLRPGPDPLVLDGPFAETKEQLLGVTIVNCKTFEEAVEAARLWASQKRAGSTELRPLEHFDPGLGEGSR